MEVLEVEVKTRGKIRAAKRYRKQTLRAANAEAARQRGGSGAISWYATRRLTERSCGALATELGGIGPECISGLTSTERVLGTRAHWALTG